MLGKGLIVSKLLANIVIMSVIAREYAVRDEPDLPEELPDSGEEAYYGETIEDLRISLEHYIFNPFPPYFTMVAAHSTKVWCT